MSDPDNTEAMLFDEIMRAIRRCEHECDATIYQALGCLEDVKSQLLQEAHEVEEEEEDDG